MRNERIEGHEWGTYVALARSTVTEHGWPTGREPEGHGVPIVVVGVTSHQGAGRAVYRGKWHRWLDDLAL